VVQDALHITEQKPAHRNYTVASDAVGMAFHATNDIGISIEPQVRFSLESGMDVLFYQGNLDLACNTAGNLRWTESMPWKGQAEFRSRRMEGLGREVGWDWGAGGDDEGGGCADGGEEDEVLRL
jgi:cathepsin A (carboxypeptidase C)